MIEMTFEAVEIPPFLLDNVLASERHYRAGQWTMDISDDVLLGETSCSTEWVQRLLSRTLACFPWATISSLEIVYSDGQRVSCDSVGSQPVVRFESVSRGEVGCNGLTATLDLCLYWTDSDGQLGASKIPQAGYLIMDRLDAGGVSIDFTIYPNLFTDTIHRLQKRDRRFDAMTLPFVPAAAMNRKRLHDSLVCWENRLHGTITSWDSDLVDGVDRHGFGDDSVPFE